MYSTGKIIVLFAFKICYLLNSDRVDLHAGNNISTSTYTEVIHTFVH